MNKKLLTLVLALIMVVAIGLTACQEQVTLTLYDSDGKTVLKTVNVKKGEAPVKPADPQKDGFTFDGWFITPTNNTPYDFTKALDEDAKAYAHWTDNNYVDDRDWVIVGNMLSWDDALTDSHFTKKQGTNNVFELTMDLHVDDEFQLTVLLENGTLAYKSNGARACGSNLSKDAEEYMEAKGNGLDAAANTNILVKKDGNYTLTLTTAAENSANKIAVKRNGDAKPVEEVEVVNYYIKGKNITSWQDVHTLATRFSLLNQKLTLTVYLAEGDDFMFTAIKTKGETSSQLTTYNITNLDAASAALFNKSGNNISVKTTGFYTFTLDTDSKTIEAKFDAEKQRDELVCFIDGNILGGKYGDFMEAVNEAKYKMTKNGDIYTIEGVELKAGEELIVRTYKASETEYTWNNINKTFNADYLHASVGFGAASKDNHNIKVGEDGTYNITFDAYMQTVSIAKDGKDVYIKGDTVNNWEHKFQDEYKFTVTQDAAVYELTIELAEGAKFGLAVYNIGESSGNGGWVGRAQLGTDGTANNMFGESGDLACATAGTYRLTYNYKTNTLDIYTVTAE